MTYFAIYMVMRKSPTISWLAMCSKLGIFLKSLHSAFLAAYCRANPDMQQEFCYEPSEFVEGDTILNIANGQIAHRFDCLSVTLEMPFKDCWSNPDAERGWSPASS